MAIRGEPALGLDPEDSDEFREALRAKKIKACIPPRRNRKVQHAFSKTMYKQRHKVDAIR